MKKLVEIFKMAKLGWIYSFISIILIFASFVLPPTGVIDNSVLMAVGEIFAFATLSKITDIIKSIQDGKSVTLKHKDTELTIADKNGSNN